MHFTPLQHQYLKQALRTALASTVALLLTQSVGLEHGYWAVISTIIVMQANLGGSIRAGIRRIVGTTVGAIVGIVFLQIVGQTWWGLGLAVFCTIALSALAMKAQETFRMAGVTTTIVILAWPGGQAPLWFGLERCGEILIGVGIAMVFSLLLWPSRAAHRLREELAEELRALALWQEHGLQQFLGRGVDESYDRVGVLSERIRSNRDLHDQALGEMRILARERNAQLLPTLGTLERVFGLVRGLSRIAAVTPSGGYQQRLEQEIWELGSECAQTMRILADRIQPGKQGNEDTPSRLPVVVEALEDKLHEFRSERATEAYPLMDVANVFAYVQTLKSLAVELEWLALKW